MKQKKIKHAGKLLKVTRKQSSRVKSHFIIYSKRIIPLLKSLQDAWYKDEPKKHAETTGLVLGQLAYSPDLAASILPVVIDFIQRKGPHGVDGILLSCMSAAQILDPRSFGQALAACDLLEVRAMDKVKKDFGLFFADLSGPSRFLKAGAASGFNGSISLTGLVETTRMTLFNGGAIGKASIGPGSFFENVVYRELKSRLQNPFIGANTYGLFVTCEQWFQGGGYVVGLLGGAAALLVTKGSGVGWAIASGITGFAIGTGQTGATVFCTGVSEEKSEDPVEDSDNIQDVIIIESENEDGSASNITVVVAQDVTNEQDDDSNDSDDQQDSDSNSSPSADDDSNDSDNQQGSDSNNNSSTDDDSTNSDNQQGSDSNTNSTNATDGDQNGQAGTCDPGDETATCPNPEGHDPNSPDVFASFSFAISIIAREKPSMFSTLVNPGSVEVHSGAKILFGIPVKGFADPNRINPNPESSGSGGSSIVGTIFSKDPRGTLVNPGEPDLGF